MNKHRNQQRRLSILEMTLLALSALVLMTAGVTHAWLRNSQVEVLRDVDHTQQRISDHEDSINSLQVKIDKKLNIYQIRDDLHRADSELCNVPSRSIEIIPTYTEPQSTDEPIEQPAVAQSHP